MVFLVVKNSPRQLTEVVIVWEEMAHLYYKTFFFNLWYWNCTLKYYLKLSSQCKNIDIDCCLTDSFLYPCSWQYSCSFSHLRFQVHSPVWSSKMSQLEPLIPQTAEPLLDTQEVQLWLDKAVAWGQAESPDTQRETCLHLSKLRDFLQQLLTHINNTVSYWEKFALFG